MLRAESSAIREAIALIQSAKRPVILAGHGITQSGAEEQVLAFAESQQIPVASTLLGLGSFPAAHPLHLGMMGMHGESWVNHAIQEADLLLAFGMRFDDRVTGNLASLCAEREEDSHRDRPVGDQQERPRGRGAHRRSAPRARNVAAAASETYGHRLAAADPCVKGHRIGARHHQSAGQWPSLRRACHSRHLARGPGCRTRTKHHHRYRCRPAPDVGGAVLQA